MSNIDTLRSEQYLLMKSMALNPTFVQCVDDSNTIQSTQVINCIEVLTDEAELTLKQYHPQTKTWEQETLMTTLLQGVYLGWFKDIAVSSGAIRVMTW